jgi:hypothetical protein
MRTALVKALSSLISIATGASFGREGSITQMSATSASKLGQVAEMAAVSAALAGRLAARRRDVPATIQCADCGVAVRRADRSRQLRHESCSGRWFSPR